MSLQFNSPSIFGKNSVLGKAENILSNFSDDLILRASEFLKTRPIQLSKLEDHVNSMSPDGFKAEFESLGAPATQLQPWDYASLPENIPKQRYPTPEDNLRCYDKTRVTLYKNPGDPHSDFIMANWVDSYSEKKRYIATQGPMESTIPDFYKMIWQYNVHEVVMLVGEEDVKKGKCAVYFPDEPTTFGEVEIELKRKIQYPGVLVRIFAMKRFGVLRVLVHHNFLGWPDMGVPKDPSELLNLIKIYRRSDTYTRAWPVVVHCAGGVGRTGTFILTDSMYDMAENEDHVDFLQHLAFIRNQRISLVEKPEQYELAHKVILEGFKEGLFDKN